ncbi:TPA: MFS transporter [bacterium]|jgi:fucose permease|nr:MFS transporter [bacterium]
MSILFLIVIYLSFISLGLPDSGFGYSWPYMHEVLKVPVEAAGLVTIIVTLCGAFSSVVSIRLSKKMSTGLIVTISSLLTGVAMLGYALADNYIIILLCSFPLGLGAGGVDATLNNYVAKHLSSRVMNWLHACWGLGAMISPLIMSFAIVSLNGYQDGYIIVALIQLSLAIYFFTTLKMWKKNGVNEQEDSIDNRDLPRVTLRNLTPWLAILTYFLYCGAENSIMVWLNTFLIESRNMTNEYINGTIVALYSGGIMGGRILTGVISNRLGNRRVIRYGITISLIGLLLLFINNPYIMMVSVLLIGLGFAPVFPSLMHETTARFSSESASRVVSYQMASANIAMLSISPLFGLIGSRFGFGLMIPYCIVIVVVLFVIIEWLNKLTPQIKKV